MVTKVAIVDDSALMRKLLTEILRSDPEFQVVGVAADPLVARELIKATNPDVLTLDVEMPRMDGLTFLRNLMRLRPMPVVMVSSLTERGADATLTALELGAIDFVAKPKIDVASGLADLGKEIINKVKIAARTTPRALASTAARTVAKLPPLVSGLRTTDRVIAIGASTGGTEALSRVMEALPADTPGIVVAQHIPPEFSRRFAERLDRQCNLTVREAKDGDPVIIGHAYIAPGQKHLRVVRSGARYVCRVTEDAAVNLHRPSVDVLFESVADQVGKNAIGVILTGMGADGAVQLGAIRRAGAPTIAQDRETSVVWGMPGEAVKRGHAAEVLPLDAIAGRILAHSRS